MLKKLPLVLASTSLVILSIAPAFAEDTMTTTSTTVASTTVTPTSTSAKVPLRQVVQPTVKAMKEEAKVAMQDAMSKAKEAFKEKLALIKDEKKKATVETIDAQIATVNKNRTDEMSANLTTLSGILDRISSKAATVGTNTTLTADITSARAAITAAQTAVTAQAAKTYTITITTETKLRPNVMTTLALFRKDLAAAHSKVVTAREGVRVAALDLEKAKNPEVSTTPTPTASTAATNQ